MFSSVSPFSCSVIIADRTVFNDASCNHFHCTPTDFAWHLFSPDRAWFLLCSKRPPVSLQQWLSSSDCRYYIEINGNSINDPTRALLTSCGDFLLVLSTADSFSTLCQWSYGTRQACSLQSLTLWSSQFRIPLDEQLLTRTFHTDPLLVNDGGLLRRSLPCFKGLVLDGFCALAGKSLIFHCR